MMFSADLSWTDPTTEKIGERRERKARERSGTSPSIKTAASSRSSISADRELWWTSGLKKAKSIKPNILRPMTGRSTSTRKDSFTPKKIDTTIPHDFKDPTLQPSWTYSSTLSPKLPSGASFDTPVFEIPELEADTSSRRTDSSETRFSHDRRWEVKTPVMETVQERIQIQHTSPVSFGTSRTRATSLMTERKDSASASSPASSEAPKLTPLPVMIEGTLSIEALKLHDALQEANNSNTLKHNSFSSFDSDMKLTHRPLSQWDCLTPRGVPQEMQVPTQQVAPQVTPKVAPKATPKTTPKATPKLSVAQNTTAENSRFLRFIRRMESAGPKIVLDRLKEEWQDTAGEEADEELALEKQLWLLTGFQMQNLGKVRVAPKARCDTGRVLELYGNLSEVYQLSAMHPSKTVHFLTTKPQRPIPLPGNVSYLTVRDFGAVPLPYPEDYFSHIRASTLPSLVPSAKLPELFRECYKLLAPGGLLEIRIMDAAPVRKTSGPLMKMWIEDRLSINLERLFRCSKPCLLVPTWLTEAGFEITTEDEQIVRLPCAFNHTSVDIDKELAAIIGQSLWKDIWGSFVEDVSDEPNWWWEDEDIVQECLQRQTVFECKSIFAYKGQVA